MFTVNELMAKRLQSRIRILVQNFSANKQSCFFFLASYKQSVSYCELSRKLLGWGAAVDTKHEGGIKVAVRN